MPFDNPFFVRECRQARRSLRAAAWGSGLVMCSLLALLIALHLGHWRWLSNFGAGMDAAAFLLVSIHGLLCLAAGTLTSRVLSVEARNGTLQQLLLLPYTPEALFRRQLVYPLHWIFIAWLAPWPFYVAAALSGVVQMGVLADLYPLPLFAGLAGLYEFTNGNTRQRINQLCSGSASREGVTVSDSLAAILPLWGLLICGGRDMLSGRPGAWMAWDPFYGGLLPRWLFWSLFGSLFTAVPLLSAVAVLSSEQPSGTAARRARVALWLLYFLTLGHTWPVLHTWHRYVLLLGVPTALPLLTIVARWSVPPRREDPLSAPEVEWAARLSDNPLFLRDLRAATRFTSLRRALVPRTCVVIGCLGALSALPLVSGLGPYIPWDQLILGTGVGLCSFLFLMPPMHAVSAWAAEQPRGAAALLLMTPLTSAELLRGRALAAVLHCWIANSVLWILALATLIYAFVRGYGLAVLPLLALAPLFVSLLAGSWTADLASYDHARSTALVLTQTITGLGALTLTFFARRIPPPLCLVLSLALFGANYWLARLTYQHALSTLDRLRREDLDTLTRTNQVT